MRRRPVAQRRAHDAARADWRAQPVCVADAATTAVGGDAAVDDGRDATGASVAMDTGMAAEEYAADAGTDEARYAQRKSSAWPALFFPLTVAMQRRRCRGVRGAAGRCGRI